MSETPAAFLRRAALHGRSITHRIAATAPPPWLSLDGGDRLIHDPGHDHDHDPPVYVVREPLDSPEAAEHFALMDPAVADGVYAWLEATAAYLDQLTPEALEEDDAASHALTVAAALLRESAPDGDAR